MVRNFCICHGTKFHHGSRVGEHKRTGQRFRDCSARNVRYEFAGYHVSRKLHQLKKENKMKTEKEKIKPISFPLYRSTFERLVKTKDKKKMTHDELLNYLLDKEEGRK